MSGFSHRFGETTAQREARGRGRGSAQRRRERRAWLVSPDAGFGGDGKRVPCYWKCGVMLDVSGLTVDRYPIAGAHGGTYRRDNIVPACRSCNERRGDGPNAPPPPQPDVF